MLLMAFVAGLRWCRILGGLLRVRILGAVLWEGREPLVKLVRFRPVWQGEELVQNWVMDMRV